MGGDGLEGEAGREYGGLRHNHFVIWVMMGGRGRWVGDLKDLRHNHFIRWVGMDGLEREGNLGKVGR